MAIVSKVNPVSKTSPDTGFGAQANNVVAPDCTVFSIVFHFLPGILYALCSVW